MMARQYSGKFVKSLLVSTIILSHSLVAEPAKEAVDDTSKSAADYAEETLVIGELLFKDTTKVSATSRITADELAHTNFVTSEDAIAHEPSLIVRRRFVGDPNGVIGIRGSNMFQGTRSMVFADGMPLHYHLQTRFSGSPRWSLVSPSEIEAVDVIYGPFSAEYSGNAMGGVIDIQTRKPSGRKVTLEGTYFSQDYDIWATDETFSGGKAHIAYEDKIGNSAFHISYNHLENQSQPQTQYRSGLSEDTDGTAVTGGFTDIDERGREAIYYGDSGAEDATTDLFKIKFNHDFGDLELRSTLAYEDRSRDSDDHNNFITDANGDTVWSGTAELGGDQGGQAFSISGSNFQNRHQDRESLLLGLGLGGKIGNDWVFDAFYSKFSILDDVEIRTGRNPSDPSYSAQNEAFRARITEYDDTGWDIFDVKFGTESLFGDPKQRISLGLHWDSYELNIIADDYNSISGLRASDEVDGDRNTGRSDSGGEASTYALFAQYGYAISERWDLALGLRFEDWETENGYSGGNNLDKRSDSGVSPKLSIGYFPTETLTLRYSVARAQRFPIVEELYRNDGRTSSGSVFVSDPSLKPEDGVFHNLSLEHTLDGGLVRLNFFRDVVEDVIFNQSTTTDNGTVTTSLPVTEVTTNGIEFIYNQKNLLGSKFNLRYNLSYIDAEITENVLNPDNVGNEFPRMPEWRSNIMLNYPITDTFDIAGSMRYASDSSGRLDNADTADNVFGAQDDYLFFNAKANLRISKHATVSLGIDNITNEEACVFHPWPSRTVFLEGKYSFSEE